MAFLSSLGSVSVGYHSIEGLMRHLRPDYNYLGFLSPIYMMLYYQLGMAEVGGGSPSTAGATTGFASAGVAGGVLVLGWTLILLFLLFIRML